MDGCVKNKSTRKHALLRVHRSVNRLIDSNRILYIDSLGRRSDIFEMVSKVVQEFWRCEDAKFSPVDFNSGL